MLKGKKLVLKFIAKSDKDTIVNRTSHSYFNLNGENSNNKKHSLKINFKLITPSDENCITHNSFLNIRNTKYDFTRLSSIEECYGVNYVLNKNAARLIGQQTGISLYIKTNQKGLQLYTSNDLSNRIGKSVEYYPNYAICLEPQGFPNAINCNKYPSIVLKKNKTYKNIIKYCIGEYK